MWPLIRATTFYACIKSIDYFHLSGIMYVFSVFRNRVGHDCRLESTYVFNHHNRLAAMVNKVVFKVIAKIGRREIYLYSDIWEKALDKFDWRHKVAIGTDESHDVCCVHHTILNHADRDIDIGFLFFRPGYITFAVRADDVLFKIFASDNLKAVAVNKFVGIKEGTLSAVLLRTEW